MRGGMTARRAVGRDPRVPPQCAYCHRRGTRAPPYKVQRSCGADVGIRPYERRREGSVFVEDIPRHGLVEQLLRLVKVAGLA